MSPNKRLVPRLLDILDTVEQNGDVVATVFQLRRILGPGGFRKLLDAQAPPKVTLAHDDHNVTVRLHTIGVNLRWAQHADPRINEAIQRLSYCLATSEPIDVNDLVLALAFLPDAAPQMPPQTPIERIDMEHALQASMAQVTDLLFRRS